MRNEVLFLRPSNGDRLRHQHTQLGGFPRARLEARPAFLPAFGRSGPQSAATASRRLPPSASRKKRPFPDGVENGSKSIQSRSSTFGSASSFGSLALNI
jgi:hypothetical protein